MTLPSMCPYCSPEREKQIAQVREARSRISELEAENERLGREVKAMDEMYSQVTTPLQNCCQRHHLGLGGEMTHELVVEEVDRLRAHTARLERVLASYRSLSDN